MRKKTIIILLTLFTSIIMFNLLYIFFDKVFIVENPYRFEYRFNKIDFILDYFYEGYHYEATLLNLILTFILSIYLSYIIIKNIGEYIFSLKS
jgi:hypothetical protein